MFTFSGKSLLLALMKNSYGRGNTTLTIVQLVLKHVHLEIIRYIYPYVSLQNNQFTREFQARAYWRVVVFIHKPSFILYLILELLIYIFTFNPQCRLYSHVLAMLLHLEIHIKVCLRDFSGRS
jgi:hypothetical protein